MGYVGKVDINGTDHLVGSTLYGVCSTAADTAAKVVTLSDYDALIEGTTIHVKFVNSNTAADPTLEVNDTGAKDIIMAGVVSPGTTKGTSWPAGAIVSLTYDGTYWVMNDVQNYSTLLTELRSAILNSAYPVGSIYMSTSSTSPAGLFGGTWEQIQNQFLLAAGSSYAAGSTGGAANVTLSTSQIPAHTHGRKSLTGAWNSRMFEGGTDGMVWLPGAVSSYGIMTYNGNVGQAGTIKVTWAGSNKLAQIGIDASHEHTSVGGGGSHNNMPPYLAVYVWKRIA